MNGRFTASTTLFSDSALRYSAFRSRSSTAMPSAPSNSQFRASAISSAGVCPQKIPVTTGWD